MAGTWRPYFLLGYESVAGSATESLTISIGETEEFEAHSIRVHSTSVSFDIIGITDQSGIPYTNATSTAMLDGNLLAAATKNEWAEVKLPIPLHLPAGTSLRFQITDTSTSTNEVWIMLVGKMRTVG